MTRHPATPYIAPFAVFLIFLALKPYFPSEYPVRVLVVAATMALFSRAVITLRPTRPMGSLLIGILVFGVWIGPDLIWPAYRQNWLFQNTLAGAAQSTVAHRLRYQYTFLTFRLLGTVVLIPVIEEVFWRGWLMRYLICSEFQKVRLGTYSALSFWLTAALFASEHGPYWDVGLLAGMAYNLWMIRTRCLGDCILAHAATNSCLAVYVVLADQWQYWL